MSESHWKKQPSYQNAVARMKKIMPSTHKPHVEITPCFAWMWVDDGLECDQTECGLRSYCRQAWQMAQIDKASSVRDFNASDAYRRDLSGKSPNRKLKPKKRSIRHKHKGTSKYSRREYVNLGRRVDDLATSLRDSLGAFYEVPKGWSRSDSIVEKVALKITKSYHALIIKGVVVARMWTDTPNRATIDVVPELVSSLGALSRSAKEGHMSEPERIPETCWAKTKPCTHRVSVFTEHIVNAIADTIKDRFNV